MQGMIMTLSVHIDVVNDRINRFPDLEYPNIDPKHGFLSSILAEIINFLLYKAAIFIYDIYVHPSIFQGGLPS